MSGEADLIERFGRRGGTPVIYLHGVPGAAVEAELVASAALACGIEIWVIDRARLAPNARGAEYLDRLAELVFRLGAGHRLPILGFSIGAALALRVAARVGGDAGPLFLLSTAGPLDVPGALDGMGAGAQVFRSAQEDDLGFALTIRIPALLSRHAPGLLRRILFAGAEVGDRGFAATSSGRATLSRVFAGAWSNGGKSYRRDLLTYVEPWSKELNTIASLSASHARGGSGSPKPAAASAHALAR